MSAHVKWPAVLTVVVGLVPMSAAAQQDGGARAAIEAGNQKFVAALGRADAAAIASLYTADAAAFPPNADVVRGRDAIQKLWQSVIDAGIGEATLETTDVEAQDNLAYESGAYVMKTKDGKVADRGKYVVVWKRAGGQWQLHRDIWNTSMPSAGK